MMVATAIEGMVHATQTVGVRVDVIKSIDVVLSSLKAAIEQKRAWLITFANPATALLAKRNPAFRDALAEFDMVAPDGIGMVLAMRMLHQESGLRISFDSTSLAPLVFRLAAEKGLGVVLIGGAAGVAEAATKRLMLAYPGLQIQAAFDGYGDLDAAVDTITTLGPDIVVAGMGAPAQEQFLLKLHRNGWVGLGFTCGGYLDQLSLKGIEYYPPWVDHYDIRWAYRFIKEPRRLWRRYLLEYPMFGLRLCGAVLTRQRLDRPPRGSRIGARKDTFV
jgi:N-acetylglucosaminyldiphosphoundecaprenol N-acetyl-beta-D-mannosaminyltransferase